MNFALIGLGFIAPRHIDAIKSVGGKITHICDIDEVKFVGRDHDDIDYWSNWEDMMEHQSFEAVDYVVICTPNHLHYQITKKARALDKKVICEKPFVTSMEELKEFYDDKNIFITLQLRYAFNILKKAKYLSERNKIVMNIEVHRGDWYYDSWKVDINKSGGLLFNIGIHYFDLLVSEFGQFVIRRVDSYKDQHIEGVLDNSFASVHWNLRINAPQNQQRRTIKFQGKPEIDLTSFTYGNAHVPMHFENLHIKAYKDILQGKGIRPKDVMGVTQLVQELTMVSLENKAREDEAYISR